jgi:YfiH family protein
LFFFLDSRGPVDLAFTDRLGGVSAPPYDELNLARSGGDDPASVAENWRRVLARFAAGASALAEMDQVHGAVVRTVDVAPSEVAECDGLVTAQRGVVLAVRVADCVPVLLADAATSVVGAAHAGRLGLVEGVVPATVARMRELGAQEIEAWIGPHVCEGCYEVPPAMREAVAETVPQSWATTTWGTPSIDLGAGVAAQLADAGVPVNDVARCTRESPDLYSYRRDGDRTGRLAGLVVLR